MKVTVKTVSDRITILENQKTRSLNEDFQLAVYRWALELKRGEEAAEAKLTELVPSVCDGKEQEAFEAYARQKGLDLSLHPLHYLFLDGKTNQARSAWRECLVYVRAAILRNIEEANK